jgi:hypothetical protein
MTVSSTDRRAGPFYGNGATTEFPFTFKVFSADDLEITYTDADGAATVLTSNFSVTLNADQDTDPGGTIEFPLSGSPMSNPESLVAVGDLDYEQSTDITNGGRFRPQVIENALDYQNILSQQLLERLERTITIPVDGPFPVTNLPNRAARYDRLMTFDDSTGQPNVSDFTQTELASAIAAAYSGAAGPLDALSFIQSGTGAVSRTALAKAREAVSAKDFGAVGDEVVDDTAAINAALAAHRAVILKAPGRYSATTINMAVAGTTLLIEPGAALVLQDETVSGINITAANCVVFGYGRAGRIESPAAWDGTNARRTFATIWVAGDDFTLSGITLYNIPRCAVQVEDAVNCTVENNRFIGNFPYADYGGVNTGHAAISYNPPTTLGPLTPTGNSSLTVVANRFETCVQGVLVGNYDSTASELGVMVTGNVFNRCWDHGVYMILGRGHTISGNNFVNCKTPIVTDGNCATVTGNSLYSTELSQTNGQQVISVRDATDSVIANNTLFGLGAAILVDAVSGTTLARNRISGNIIRRMGAGFATNGIRLGFNAEVCTDNVVENNTISGGNFGSAGAIQLEMKAPAGTYAGSRNVVRNNTVIYQEAMAAYGIVLYALDHNYLEIEDNKLVCEATAAAPQILYMAWAVNCNYPVISRNKFWCATGGANISIRGIQTSLGSAVVEKNIFHLTSASLAAADPIGFVTAANSTVVGNQLDGTVAMRGTITWLAGSSSYVLTNANVSGAHTRFRFTPTNNNAGALVAGTGVTVSQANGSVTMLTSGGIVTPNDCTFNYALD